LNKKDKGFDFKASFMLNLARKINLKEEYTDEYL